MLVLPNLAWWSVIHYLKTLLFGCSLHYCPGCEPNRTMSQIASNPWYIKTLVRVDGIFNRTQIQTLMQEMEVQLFLYYCMLWCWSFRQWNIFAQISSGCDQLKDQHTGETVKHSTHWTFVPHSPNLIHQIKYCMMS